MAICGVAAALPVLTYDPVRSALVLKAPCIWRIPEQAPTGEYSGRFLEVRKIGKTCGLLKKLQLPPSGISGI